MSRQVGSSRGGRLRLSRQVGPGRGGRPRPLPLPHLGQLESSRNQQCREIRVANRLQTGCWIRLGQGGAGDDCRSPAPLHLPTPVNAM